MKKIALLAALLLSSCASIQPQSQMVETGVKIITAKGGHGSGVHIGNGYIITAAHVVTTEKSEIIQTTDNNIRVGEVMWANTKYDVALIRVKGYENIRSSRLDCRAPELGEEISTFGNPLLMDFVTTYGRVAKPNSFSIEGRWEDIWLAQIPIERGNSGGAVFDAQGDTIGIVVGINNDFKSMAVVVSAPAICRLLGIS